MGQIENRKGTIELRLKCLRFACVPSGPAVGVVPFSLLHELAVRAREWQREMVDSSVVLIVVYQWPRMLVALLAVHLKFDNAPNGLEYSMRMRIRM